MSSSDSTPTATPIATPEGSVYTPTTASSVSGLSFSQASLINQPLDTPYRDSALSPFEDTRSEAGSTTSTDDEAEAEWQESLHQLELLLSLLVIPFFGKWVGRRCAYWAWAGFMTWKYPVEVVITDRKAFSVAGVLGVLSSTLSNVKAAF